MQTMTDNQILSIFIIAIAVLIGGMYAKMILIYRDVQMKRVERIKKELYEYHKAKGTLRFYLGEKFKVVE
jgi:hypothetical protein